MKNPGNIIWRRWFTTVAMVKVLFLCHASPAQNVVAWGSNTQGQTNVPPSATNVIAVAAGWYHSLALRSDGSVVSWGAITNVPDDATNVISIAAGAASSLALRADGKVCCWGDNSWRQSNQQYFSTKVIAIAAGNYHNLALLANGTVRAWGKDSYGQSTVPAGLTNVVAISAGAEHSMAMTDDGSVVIWGGSNVYPLSSAKSGFPKSTINVAAFAAGATFNLYLSTAGRLYQSGSYTIFPNSSATNFVAIATGTNFSLALTRLGSLSAWGTGTATNVPLSATNVIAMAAGLAHGLAVKGDGSPHVLSSPAYCALSSAGNNLPLLARAVGKSPLQYQWLADGTPIPGATNALPAVPAVWGNDPVGYQVVVSNSMNCVTSSIARVAVRSLNLWGVNLDGQTRIPRSVFNPLAIATGPFHNLVIQADGTMVAFGKNWTGQTNVPAGLTNIIMAAAGSDHSLALKNDGTVIAWGKNSDGQATVPSTATNVVAVAAGWAHSVALRADGTVITWGNNDYGQIPVSFLANQVISIAAGYYHTLALNADGSVVSWGYQTDVPPSATNVTAIAAGWGHNLALRADGTLIAWGDNTFGQSTIPPTATNIVAIAAGWYLSLALRADGTIVTWGKNGLFANSATNTPAGLSGVGSIGAGEDFCAAMVQTGNPRFPLTVATMSASQGGRLFYQPSVLGSLPMTYQWSHDGVIMPDQTNRFLNLPAAQITDGGTYELTAANQFGTVTRPVVACTVAADPRSYSAVGAWGGCLYNNGSDLPSGVVGPVAIAAGNYHNLVLQADGTVKTSGDNNFGETNLPPNLTNAIAIAAGYFLNVALRADHRVVAWGNNSAGQTNVPAAATNIIAIAAREYHCLALRSDGTVMAWGDQTNVPEHLTDVIAISAGYLHNLALRSDHTVVAWGMQSLVPVSANNAVAIAAGFDHSLALKPDGTIVAWGENAYGQCNVPASVTNAVAIAAGWAHSLALLNDGNIVVWGQLAGVFTNNNRGGFIPVRNIPAGLHHVGQIACGDSHDFALVTYGAPRIEVPMPALNPHIGGPASLLARVEGSEPLTCQWYHDANPIEGATNRWLQNTNFQSADAGTYTLVASNPTSSASSAPAVLVADPTPYFLTPLPTQQNALVGMPWSLTMPSGGEQPLAYQWQLNGGNLAGNGRIQGADSPGLSFNSTLFQDSGSLTLMVTNNSGTYTGLVANVAITPVLGWGDDSSGQLDVPAAVTDVVLVASGGDHNLAQLKSGMISAWGDNSYDQNKVPFSAYQAVALAEGDTHSLALKPNGSVVAWGDNGSGQTNVPATVQNAVAIAAGTWFSQALLPDGSVIQWGSSHPLPATFTNLMLISTKAIHTIGLRGDGTLVEAYGSAKVPLNYSNVVAICASQSDSLALQSDGNLVAWGKSDYGQTNIPSSAKNIVAIAAGDDHFVALRADGAVIAWGSTNYSQTAIPALPSGIGLISAGSVHSLAVLGQPFQRMAKAGEAVTFSAGIYANRLATYQWQLNGEDIPGATNASFALGSVFWTNSGSYRVVIKNPLGAVTSPAMTLSVPPLKLEVTALNTFATNGAFQFRLTGSSGLNPVTIYSSSNLLDWQPVFTNPPTTGNIDYTDLPPTFSPQRFYRAIEQP